MRLMAYLSISEAARQAGLRASALRFYEEVGVLPPALRVSGQRRYDHAIVNRLAMVKRAQQSGFTLDEIRELFSGDPRRNPVSARWNKLADRKLMELQTRIDDLFAMKSLLDRMKARCGCRTIDECGAGIRRATTQATPQARKQQSLARPI